MSNFTTTPAIAGLSTDNLAEVLRARRLALAREALRMKQRGESLREIGRALGVSYETARTLCREAEQAEEAQP